MTFRTRIIFGYAALLFVTVIVMLLSLRFLLEQYTMKQLDAQHAHEARELALVAPEADTPGREEQWRHHLHNEEDVYNFHLHTADGRVVYRSRALEGVTPGRFEGLSPGRHRDFAGLGECWITMHPVDGYVLHIVTPLTEPLRVIRHFNKIALGVLFASIAVSLLTGALYARWLVRPLVRLEQAAIRIDSGEADRIPAALAVTGDEVGRIARRLNSGYERIAGAIDRLRFFSAEVSHELRTPLSIVKLNAERMLSDKNTPEPVRTMATEQLEEIERLKRFITNLLGFAKLESGTLRMEPAAVAAKTWFGEFAEDATALAEDAGLRFTLRADCGCEATFDTVWMRMVLFNLLRNALRFSPRGGEISLSAFCDRGDLVMILQDEGPGIHEERLEKIFDRYMRFGEEREPSESIGLGLAISRSVVNLHGGSIRAENRTDRSGLRVIIRLPQRA